MSRCRDHVAPNGQFIHAAIKSARFRVSSLHSCAAMVKFTLVLAAITASVSVAAGELSRRQLPPVYDESSVLSCFSLTDACNAAVVDVTNFYNYTACALLTVCAQGILTIPEVLANLGAPADQPRLTETTFNTISGGQPYVSQQAYIDAYYGQISITPNGTYPDNVIYLIDQWQSILAWTGFCDTGNVPYSNFADWFEYSAVTGVCPAVASCDADLAAATLPCVPQPTSDNGSCAELVAQCELWVTGGLFQNEYCVLASFCYAWTTTDVLLYRIYYSTYVRPIPTSLQQQRLSESVFYAITGGSQTMTQQNAIDAYYGALTGTYVSLGGPFGDETPYKTSNNGPYPTSPEYVIEFWSIISAWTGFCDTLEIPYNNLADYLTYAATSNYHPTC